MKSSIYNMGRVGKTEVRAHSEHRGRPSMASEVLGLVEVWAFGGPLGSVAPRQWGNALLYGHASPSLGHL